MLEMSLLDRQRPPWAISGISWVLPWATGPLISLENIAEVTDWQIPKATKSSTSDFLLISFLSSFSLSQASAIMAEAITNAKKKQCKSLGIALTTYCYHRTWTTLQWFSSTPMLMLSAICRFVGITLFIASMTPPESSSSLPWKVKTTTARVRWYNAKHREGMCMFPEVLYC